ncbi:MAG TPA: SPOR domain-containing protein [Sphingomonas sp.]|nr:SPOR domain-containing protein [Sphingomonas sp.]
MIRLLSRSTVLGLGALLLASGSIVSAQYADRPADRLSRYLRELAANPASLTALIGAGNAALDVGDGNAALGFFARADERSPRNGPVKAGLARALLMVDNPREALKMFDAARSLGVPDIQLAPDRGLAYDLRGENRRAQQDYALALSRGPNDEVTKRYALSLGITGQRDQALSLLEPLLYRRDQGAWRARAFVLALTGDVPGASRIAHQVMPDRMAQSMDAFFARLGGLNSAQKAAAVHLGEMPADKRYGSNAPVPPPPVYAMPTPAPTPMPTADARELRRRSSRSHKFDPAPVPTPTPTPPPPGPAQLAATDQAPFYAATPGMSAPVYAPGPSAPLARVAPQQRGDLDAIMRDIRGGKAAPKPAPTRVAQAKLTPPKPTPTPTPKSSAAKKPEPETAKQKDAAKEAPAKPGAKNAKAAAADKKKKPEQPKEPARIWVQVAGGANKGALPKEWAGISGKTRDLKGKGAWTAKNRATNRLLIGPFKSEAEAQTIVTKLRKAGVGAFQWTSEEGEAVEKIGGK